MAPSFDFASSNLLLCGEDNNSLMCFEESDYGYVNDDDDFDREDLEEKNYQNQSFFSGGDFCLMGGFPLQSDECMVLMIEKESDHLPRDDYLMRLRNGNLDIKARREAIDWIIKVHTHYNFSPLCAYLAVNYLDRFLSVYELPRGKVWMMQLLAVSCLSLSAKMEETEVPLSLDLQVCESKFIFEAKTIQRMELLILSNLKWRMQSITPFSLIDYFLHKINNDHHQSLLPITSSSPLISRSIELILSTIKGIDLLEFRPSEIASSIAIYVSEETQKGIDIDKSISSFNQVVEKERVIKCLELIKINESKSSLVVVVPESPIGVLDVTTCMSYKTEEELISVVVGSCGGNSSSSNNSSSTSPEAKRRRLNKTTTQV